MNDVKRTIFIIHGSHHLTDHSFNGDGLVAWGFVNELARRGHRIHVATDKLDVLAPVPENLTLVEFPRTHAHPVLHYISYMRRVRTYYERLVAEGGVDIVHQMNPVVRGISLSLVGKHVPIVLGTYVGDWVGVRTAAHYRAPSLSHRLANAFKLVIDAIQQHFASALVLATPHALGRVPLSFDVGKRIEYLHHGVDTELYRPQALPTDPVHLQKRILYVGSIQPNKGVFVLADAFATVAAAHPDASLVMVGSGKFVDQLKQRFTDLGILERVTFTGRATRAEVAGWMRASDVLCAPSYGEPYGQNVLEAMASGKPVVITTFGGHRYLGDAHGAIAVEPGDAGRLSAALLAVLDDPARADEMGRHNRDLAEHQHAWPRVTDRLEAIYERAIARCAVASAQGR